MIGWENPEVKVRSEIASRVKRLDPDDPGTGCDTPWRFKECRASCTRSGYLMFHMFLSN